MQDELGEMKEEMRGLRRELAPLPGSIDRMATELDSDLGSVEGAVRDLAPRLEAMQGELGKLRDDLGGLPFVGKS